MHVRLSGVTLLYARYSLVSRHPTRYSHTVRRFPLSFSCHLPSLLIQLARAYARRTHPVDSLLYTPSIQ